MEEIKKSLQHIEQLLEQIEKSVSCANAADAVKATLIDQAKQHSTHDTT